MKVYVIGGGPAGMMAACSAAYHGASVTLLEKMDRLGRKLSITGKGRCNLTSALELDQFIMQGYAGNGRFLYSSLHAFSNQDLMDFFQSRGLKLKVERGQRVFPVSDQAHDVVQVLQQELHKLKIEVVTGARVDSLVPKGTGFRINCGSRQYDAPRVIVATGGLSYPGTGSTGDGYKWARNLGHHVVEPRPGLVPLVAHEDWIPSIKGLSLKNVQATAYQADGKRINSEFGELLFTHFGLSGPIILSMSRDIGQYLHRTGQTVKIVIDLKPALTWEQVEARLQRDLNRYARRHFANSLDDLLPRKLIPVIVGLSGIDPHQQSGHIKKDERRRLTELLKALPVTITATRPVEEAIVTAGGIDIREVDPRTMESRLHRNLFFAGEVLDVDGYTGGFNLQAAFSTGYLAGQHSAMIS
ncbi:MAG TPA: NAD(P)/FAD-dependent oxidoreductase [Syntrophomonadaceae bacterium]|nr:NAD(P)/FAD-dependent oxidoreductase [Syntrophomonadaceae bacterium]HQA08240.1 NAD(P)/FAD-dependent oxidoreductase [Syntrophomonadaceae bacterium]HQE23468.1 NAD(P)/FAD-dependent oxidoreductase [Syntrophomonadaceae bacterium]